MPHLRKRYLQTLLEHTLKYSPIVGLLGHRQVGKTILSNKISKEYVTLDKRSKLDFAQDDPETFLKEHQGLPSVIDECQYAPELFPALKEWVRVHPKPGQFLLTGSVRFSSRKSIRESLTGRIISWELLPMSVSEAYQAPLSDSLNQLIVKKNIDFELPQSKYWSEHVYEKYLLLGGLPGIFAIREGALRQQRFETQIETLLERDLRLLQETTLSYRNLKDLLTLLALEQGQPLELSALCRKARISAPTMKKLIGTLEAMYLIRLISTEGSQKRPVLFFEDQGEATFLAGNRYDALTQLTRFLYANLRLQWAYRPELEGSVFQFRNRAGALVPLVFRNKHGEIGIIPSLEENPKNLALATARSFLKTYPKSKVVFVHLGKLDLVLSSRMRVVGVGQLI